MTPGSTFGDYKVVRLLGKGGMGEVWLLEGKSGNLVAAKILEATADHEARRRFLREAQLALGVKHPNLVETYDVGEDPESGLCYILMEYVPGGTLADYIKANGALAIEDAVAVIEAITGVLELGRQKGIVHRDIKPANIMFDAEGTPKLADLGIARAGSAGTETTTVTQTGVMIGTPAYMSPEQMLDAHSVDTRADIYSLGVVFFEMLTGERPNKDDTIVQLMAKAMKGEPLPDVRTLRPEVSASLAQLLNMMVAPDKDGRISTPGQITNALAIIERGGEFTAHGGEGARRPTATTGAGRAVAPRPPDSSPAGRGRSPSAPHPSPAGRGRSPSAPDSSPVGRATSMMSPPKWLVPVLVLAALAAVFFALRPKKSPPPDGASAVPVREVVRTNVVERVIERQVVKTNVIERDIRERVPEKEMPRVHQSGGGEIQPAERNRATKKPMWQEEWYAKSRAKRVGDLKSATLDGRTWWYMLTEGGDAVLTRRSWERQTNDGGAGACVSPAPTGELTLPSQLDGHPVIGMCPFAFANLRQLTAVTIPEGYLFTEGYVFYTCSELSDVRLPDSLRVLTAGTFDVCRRLQTLDLKNVVLMQAGSPMPPNCLKITVAEDNAAFSVVEGVLYAKNRTELVYYPYERLSVSIAPTVVKIKEGAFQRLRERKLVLPEQIREIVSNAFGSETLREIRIGKNCIRLGMRAFQRCTGLKHVIFEGDMPQLVPHQSHPKEGLFVPDVPNLWMRNPGDLTVYVHRASRGWNGPDKGGLPTLWPLVGNENERRPIRYVEDGIPDVPPEADARESRPERIDRRIRNGGSVEDPGTKTAKANGCEKTRDGKIQTKSRFSERQVRRMYSPDGWSAMRKTVDVMFPDWRICDRLKKNLPPQVQNARSAMKIGLGYRGVVDGVGDILVTCGNGDVLELRERKTIGKESVLRFQVRASSGTKIGLKGIGSQRPLDKVLLRCSESQVEEVLFDLSEYAGSKMRLILTVEASAFGQDPNRPETVAWANLELK